MRTCSVASGNETAAEVNILGHRRTSSAVVTDDGPHLIGELSSLRYGERVSPSLK